MPSELPVIALRVTPDRLKRVKRVANASGMSMSLWLNGVLDLVLPMSEKAMRAALMGEQATAEFIGDLRQMADSVGVQIDDLLND